MKTKLYAAIITAVHLVKTCGMSLHYACRAAAWEHGVDPDLLYRELTQ
jgi:hypothetical protein